MKKAAVISLAELAKKPVPEQVILLMKKLTSFWEDYIYLTI